MEENKKLRLQLSELSLLFLILKCISMYDNYLHLVKIITLSEKSQAEEWWHFGDLQEPYTTAPQLMDLLRGL